MTSESNNPVNDRSDLEELTAYLDGELEQKALQRVEQRLGADPVYRAEMQSLQKTWDLLDELPQTEPGTSFTKTTMEVVVGNAVSDVKKKRKRVGVWPGRIAIVLALPAFLFATSFGLIRNLQTQSDRLLIQDLGVIDNHYRYAVVENDMDFLSRLSQKGLFSDSASYTDGEGLLERMLATSDVELTPATVTERQQYVESLNVEQKKKLKKKMDDYLELSKAERETLKNFDRELNKSENRLQLSATMNAYYDWLKSIDSGDRSRLLDLAVDERIRGIRTLREQQALEEFGSNGLVELPTREDAETVYEWYEFNFGAKERQIREHFPAAVSQYAKQTNTPTPPKAFIQRKGNRGDLPSLVGFLMRADRDFIEDLVLQDREMHVLYHMLTPTAKAILDERSEDQQRELVLMWIESANQSKCDVSINRLRQFEKTLTVKERDELDKLSSEGYVEALRRKYRERQKTSNSRGFGAEQNWEREWELLLDQLLIQ